MSIKKAWKERSDEMYAAVVSALPYRDLPFDFLEYESHTDYIENAINNPHVSELTKGWLRSSPSRDDILNELVKNESPMSDENILNSLFEKTFKGK